MSHAASNWAKRVRAGGTTNKAILLVLADYANHAHECWPSFERVAAEAECSVSTVKRAIADMEGRGLLQRKRRRRPDGTLGCYLMALHVDADGLESAVDNVSQKDAEPEVNLTRGQIDLRSNKGPTTAQIDLAEPGKLEPSESCAALRARTRTREGEEGGWVDRLAEAHAVLGDAVNLTSAALHVWGPLRALVEPASGEPCSWQDVLDALTQIGIRLAAKGQRLNSWAHPAVRELACAARDARLAGNREAVAHGQPAFQRPTYERPGRPATRADSIWRLAAAAAEAERRRDTRHDYRDADAFRIAGSLEPL